MYVQHLCEDGCKPEALPNTRNVHVDWREKSEENPFNQHAQRGRESEKSVQQAQPEREYLN